MYGLKEDIRYNNETLVIFTLYDKRKVGSYSFEELLQDWLQYYDTKTDFMLLFDIRFLESLPSVTYCFKMALFIYNLKKREKHYLKQSTILVKQQGIIRMLDFIFWIQSPVAPVLIYKPPEQLLSHYDLATSSFKQLVLTNEMKLVYP